VRIEKEACMTKEEKLDKVCKDFASLSGDKQGLHPGHLAGVGFCQERNGD
jgi:hypothetical protein